jgi:hypothetical protein
MSQIRTNIIATANTVPLRDNFSNMFSRTPLLTDSTKKVATTEFVQRNISHALGLADISNLNDVVMSGTTKAVELNGPSVTITGDLIVKRIILQPNT